MALAALLMQTWGVLLGSPWSKAVEFLSESSGPCQQQSGPQNPTAVRRAPQWLLARVTWTRTGSPTGKGNQHVENIRQGLAGYHIPPYLTLLISEEDSHQGLRILWGQGNPHIQQRPIQTTLPRRRLTGRKKRANGNRDSKGKGGQKGNDYF